MQTLTSRAGVWHLGIRGDRFVWTVNTTGGPRTATGATKVEPYPATPYIVKATFNSSSGQAMLFVNSQLDGASGAGAGAEGVPPGPVHLHAALTPGTPIMVGVGELGALGNGVEGGGARARARGGAGGGGGGGVSAGVPGAYADYFNGSVEEVYFKNVSCENRHAYIYADDNRPTGTFLIDLDSAPGRKLFATAINSVLNQAPKRKGGNKKVVGSFLDVVSASTRTMHPRGGVCASYVQMSKQNRIDCHPCIVERLPTTSTSPRRPTSPPYSTTGLRSCSSSPPPTLRTAARRSTLASSAGRRRRTGSSLLLLLSRPRPRCCCCRRARAPAAAPSALSPSPLSPSAALVGVAHGHHRHNHPSRLT